MKYVIFCTFILSSFVLAQDTGFQSDTLLQGAQIESSPDEDQLVDQIYAACENRITEEEKRTGRT